jgi:hypothetical protein
MAITSLYKDYFQKSRIFMYPILEIKRGASVTPIETYLSWENQYSLCDRKLICHYHLRDDSEFTVFEKEKLLGNKLFYDFKQVEDNKGVYVFDFNPHAEDWDNIRAGKYSKLSPNYKKRIENFYGKKDSNFAYIESYMNPEKYYKMYSEMMGVKESLLMEVGELCSHVDFNKETLKTCIKNLEFNSKLT